MSGSKQLATWVAAYQGGRHADGAAARVEKWLSMYRADHRYAIADELANVLQKAFLTRDQAVQSACDWMTRPASISQGLIETWDQATFLQVQFGGSSQHTLLTLLDAEADRQGLLRVSQCRGTRLFVYVDEMSVHGMRILNDLTPWLRGAAPRECVLLLAFQRRLLGREDYVTNQLTTRACSAGKTVHVRWWTDDGFSRRDCYWPATLPEHPMLTGYLSDSGVEPRLRYGNGCGQYFSSEESRRLLEAALLLAGVSVLRHNPGLAQKKYMLPLGNTVWPGLGIGVPIVTWRNCPNSAPLALWAEGLVPALFPRTSNWRP